MTSLSRSAIHSDFFFLKRKCLSSQTSVADVCLEIIITNAIVNNLDDGDDEQIKHCSCYIPSCFAFNSQISSTLD